MGERQTQTAGRHHVGNERREELAFYKSWKWFEFWSSETGVLRRQRRLRPEDEEDEVK